MNSPIQSNTNTSQARTSQGVSRPKSSEAELMRLFARARVSRQDEWQNYENEFGQWYQQKTKTIQLILNDLYPAYFQKLDQLEKAFDKKEINLEETQKALTQLDIQFDKILGDAFSISSEELESKTKVFIGTAAIGLSYAAGATFIGSASFSAMSPLAQQATVSAGFSMAIGETTRTLTNSEQSLVNSLTEGFQTGDWSNLAESLKALATEGGMGALTGAAFSKLLPSFQVFLTGLKTSTGLPLLNASATIILSQMLASASIGIGSSGLESAVKSIQINFDSTLSKEQKEAKMGEIGYDFLLSVAVSLAMGAVSGGLSSFSQSFKAQINQSRMGELIEQHKMQPLRDFARFAQKEMHPDKMVNASLPNSKSQELLEEIQKMLSKISQGSREQNLKVGEAVEFLSKLDELKKALPANHDLVKTIKATKNAFDMALMTKAEIGEALTKTLDTVQKPQFALPQAQTTKTLQAVMPEKTFEPTNNIVPFAKNILVTKQAEINKLSTAQKQRFEGIIQGFKNSQIPISQKMIDDALEIVKRGDKVLAQTANGKVATNMTMSMSGGLTIRLENQNLTIYRRPPEGGNLVFEIENGFHPMFIEVNPQNFSTLSIKDQFANSVDDSLKTQIETFFKQNEQALKALPETLSPIQILQTIQIAAIAQPIQQVPRIKITDLNNIPKITTEEAQKILVPNGEEGLFEFEYEGLIYNVQGNEIKLNGQVQNSLDLSSIFHKVRSQAFLALEETSLTNMDFRQIILPKKVVSNFLNCDLVGVKAVGVKWGMSSFNRSTNLSGGDFSGSNFEKTYFGRVENAELAIWENCHFSGATFAEEFTGFGLAKIGGSQIREAEFEVDNNIYRLQSRLGQVWVEELNSANNNKFEKINDTNQINSFLNRLNTIFPESQNTIKVGQWSTLKDAIKQIENQLPSFQQIPLPSISLSQPSIISIQGQTAQQPQPIQGQTPATPIQTQGTSPTRPSPLDLLVLLGVGGVAIASLILQNPKATEELTKLSDQELDLLMKALAEGQNDLPKPALIMKGSLFRGDKTVELTINDKKVSVSVIQGEYNSISGVENLTDAELDLLMKALAEGQSGLPKPALITNGSLFRGDKTVELTINDKKVSVSVIAGKYESISIK